MSENASGQAEGVDIRIAGVQGSLLGRVLDIIQLLSQHGDPTACASVLLPAGTLLRELPVSELMFLAPCRTESHSVCLTPSSLIGAKA